MRPLRLSTMLAILTGVALLAAACGTTGNPPGGVRVPDLDEEEGPPPEDIVSEVGTVRYVELEGGFYGLVADDSTRYMPDSLGTEFQRDSLRVRFRGVVPKEVMNVQMWGTPIEILKIRKLPDY